MCWRLRSYRAEMFLVLDQVSQAHLEIVKPRSEGGTSLLEALDRTVTPLGRATAAALVAVPVARRGGTGSPSAVDRRSARRAGLSCGKPAKHLREVRDLERTVGRLSQANGNARDLAGLGSPR